MALIYVAVQHKLISVKLQVARVHPEKREAVFRQRRTIKQKLRARFLFYQKRIGSSQEGPENVLPLSVCR
jgi:hypothetical protein